ncbi:MAG: type II secretion system F family protein [Candidatus Saccharimonadales bacterium]
MKKFEYQARDLSTSKIVKSTVQAESENAAGRLLLDQGFSPISLKEVTEGSGFFGKLGSRVTTKHKIVFTRQLATLIGAGLPLSQSLHTILTQTDNKTLRGVIEALVADIEAGRSLTEAFSKHDKVFSKVFLALVAAGEASGTLDDSLRRIADQQEKDAEISGKIKGALTYPVIVLFVIGGVMGFMLFTVVPQVEKLYEDLNKELPMLTQIMVDTASFIEGNGLLVLLGVGVAIYGLTRYLKTPAGIKFSDTFKLAAPLFGQLFQKLYMARLTRTAQTLLATGVPMLDTLNITADAVNNVTIAKGVHNAADKVKGGKALSESIEPEDYILPLVPQMIKIGEQSGKMDEMLGKAAKVYEDELDAQIRTISTLIEPLLMVVLAIVAGGMVAAILFPIYALVGEIQT